MVDKTINDSNNQTASVTPFGTLEDWTDADIAAMATINAVTIADARADAVRSAAKLVGLLEAKADA